ncbi:hypothetical protein HU200_029481 [Digitaria exilis]|uniref:Core Histone H2A/H2B/H3 domain-containing protein n=1 Tax=Digitaria exilis TaxID=1010633 RepID=A0A835BU59_9POAL|nr:hypothetical protein HU200_029481 [Digitaria exilis]CAB3489603.1 unnamed protein product [Digitaria exilis]
MAIGSLEGAGHQQEFHGSPPTALPSAQQEELDDFWRKTQEDIESTMDFNNHILPMSYVAEIIRDYQGSFMMSSDTPQVLTKLVEIFTQELTVRASMCAKSHERTAILESSDIYEAINSVESYVFLNDVLQRPRANHDQAPMSSNVLQLQQESHFLAATSTRNGPTDPFSKLGEQAFQFHEDNLVPTIRVQPDHLELKNDEDLNMPGTSSGTIEEAK